MEKPLPGEPPTLHFFARALHGVAEKLPRTGKPWSELTKAEQALFEGAALTLVRDSQNDLLGAVLEEVDARRG